MRNRFLIKGTYIAHGMKSQVHSVILRVLGHLKRNELKVNKNIELVKLVSHNRSNVLVSY